MSKTFTLYSLFPCNLYPVFKTELLYLVERYFARRFHGTVYFLNQLSSDLDRWEALPDQVNFRSENKDTLSLNFYLFSVSYSYNNII